MSFMGAARCSMDKISSRESFLTLKMFHICCTPFFGTLFSLTGLTLKGHGCPMLLFCLLIYFFHDVDGVFAIYFFDVNFDNFLLGCWNIFSSEVWSNGKLTMPSVNEYAELYSLWPSKVKQGIQGSSHRSTCVNHVINENYDGVINAFRDYGLMDNGVRTQSWEVISVQCNIQLTYWYLNSFNGLNRLG